MNKPRKYKKIFNIDESYQKTLANIFSDYFLDYNITKYNRDIFFKEIGCKFIVERFDINNKKMFDIFLNSSKDFLGKLEELYGAGKFWNIQISKMNEKSKILPHIDEGLGFLFSHRIHIPLITNENFTFCIDDDEFYFPIGSAYEINNYKKHSVFCNNISKKQTRVHLILDYISYEYVPFVEIKKSPKRKFEYN